MRTSMITAAIVPGPARLVVAGLIVTGVVTTGLIATGLAITGFVCTGLAGLGCSRPAAQVAPARPASDALSGARTKDVELLDPGREPRAVLRYRFQVGTHEPYLTISTDDVAPGPIRAYNLADARVEAVLADGSARLDIALRRSTYAGEPADRRKLHVDARGQLVDDGTADNSLPADALLVALPVEPVGVGARWRTRRPHTADSAIGYELLAIEPGGAHVRETASVFENGTEIGNATEWERESTTQWTGDVHVAWNRVVPRAERDAREFGRTHTRPIPGIRGGAPDHIDVGGMTFRTSIVPDGALAPPAFFPGDVGPVLMAMMPAWLPIGSPLCASPDGPLSGPFATRYPGGTPAVAGTCNAGQPDGDWTWWDDSGGVISRGQFRAGRPDGIWKQLSRGRVLGSFTLRGGTGEVRAWWPSGGKRLAVDFVDGIPRGAVASWRADGTRELEGRFDSPRGQGTWTEFDAHGAVIRTWKLNEAGRPLP